MPRPVTPFLVRPSPVGPSPDVPGVGGICRPTTNIPSPLITLQRGLTPLLVPSAVWDADKVLRAGAAFPPPYGRLGLFRPPGEEGPGPSLV